MFNATGGPKGSTAGDFKDAGCPLHRAGKMNLREANGLSLVRTMLNAAGRGYRDAMAAVEYGVPGVNGYVADVA